jgi:hypothetical protein
MTFLVEVKGLDCQALGYVGLNPRQMKTAF